MSGYGNRSRNVLFSEHFLPEREGCNFSRWWNCAAELQKRDLLDNYFDVNCKLPPSSVDHDGSVTEFRLLLGGHWSGYFACVSVNHRKWAGLIASSARCYGQSILTDKSSRKFHNVSILLDKLLDDYDNSLRPDMGGKTRNNFSLWSQTREICQSIKVSVEAIARQRTTSLVARHQNNLISRQLFIRCSYMT